MQQTPPFPLRERDIGGLGILMVKKSMDDVVYEYRDGCNILTLSETSLTHWAKEEGSCEEEDKI